MPKTDIFDAIANRNSGNQWDQARQSSSICPGFFIEPNE